MGKVSPHGADDEDDLILRVEGLELRAMVRANGKQPAKEWFDSLAKTEKARIAAGLRSLSTSLAGGRGTGGRLEKIQASREGLSEFRGTKQGGTPPHLRIVVKRVGSTLYAAMGFKKTSNELPKAVITEADRIAAEWRER